MVIRLNASPVGDDDRRGTGYAGGSNTETERENEHNTETTMSTTNTETSDGGPRELTKDELREEFGDAIENAVDDALDKRKESKTNADTAGETAAVAGGVRDRIENGPREARTNTSGSSAPAPGGTLWRGGRKPDRSGVRTNSGDDEAVARGLRGRLAEQEQNEEGEER